MSKMTAPKSTTNLLKQLRSSMQNQNFVSEPIAAYIIPSADAHNGEYLADCDKYRAFISGFNGSAGTAIVTDKQACMWTDGRYWLQAREEMDDNWTLMKEGDPNTLKTDQWLIKTLPNGSKVGVDPTLFTHEKFSPLQQELETIGHKLIPVKQNLVELLWSDRPQRPLNPVKPLPVTFTGKTIKDKMLEVIAAMNEKKAKYFVVTALDQIAWVLNLRGSDIEYNPVFFSYLIIKSDATFTLFIDPRQASEEVKEHLKSEAGCVFTIEPYTRIEEALKEISTSLDQFVWFSEFSSYALTSIIPKKHLLLTSTTPIELMKAVKNPTEAQGMRNAHIKDAVALCCYFSWLEKNVASGNVTEVSGAAKLHELRKLQADFMGDSFETISSVGPHGAIIHYQPSKATDVPIRTDCLYLCDSGAQYRDGTTDVTRTWHFGTPTEYEKECYTRVLKGQLQLASRIFPTKLKGNHLDSFAREFLWDVGLDYGHGTGHGIGHYLNVHEGPMGISWRVLHQDPGLEANMFLSNEPGYYEDGKFGMRIEDIVQVVPANTPHNFNNRGFLTFDTITLVPKSINLINVKMLTDGEIEQLNKYHQLCRDVVGPLLEKAGEVEAKEWLWRQSTPISR
ncbi:xaa-Pro aminopeptidase 1 [Anthonomus grandis grandis]|uniref:xaa-Pro aminopeptidase 1 n=1 Tax=Anthonomus grandis grandis TaxID=2921223 RepID=UPI002165FBED|nr:xaa-Pro aminopeptidase 1 [Anthonomus grandis grandis]XP_050307616.1 xaa-Pro aminopeptidase 1 [Anthonomus grandis grandis]XP_050307617.1 xaa-Pro aminopeptidase 1 [Anthonomus grandis grandis]XP_050307618.1 xaa-Pro aminopeptidase 1 [Anthonomus grandis grandis]XP_050307619.1 xaa-Pro aminopeptidase 1 [Anthonomus grandis grandis]XP_050307620.1 xaa-Pro aminopeptidase 1 [Anthonomus grandis grandis]